jgi:hypothetical protein
VSFSLPAAFLPFLGDADDVDFGVLTPSDDALPDIFPEVRAGGSSDRAPLDEEEDDDDEDDDGAGSAAAGRSGNGTGSSGGGSDWAVRFLSDKQPLGRIERLKEAEKKITAMLSDRLKLVINPRKTLLQPLCRGIDHLGYYHLRLKTRVRRRVVAAARQKIDWAARGQAESEGIAASVNSYLGHFSQADSFVLRRSVCRRLLTGDVAMGALSVNGDFTAVRARRPRVKNGISVGQLLLDESGWAMSD